MKWRQEVCSLLVKVLVKQNFFISVFERPFKMMKNGVYFIGTLGCGVIQDFDLCRLDDL